MRFKARRLLPPGLLLVAALWVSTAGGQEIAAVSADEIRTLIGDSKGKVVVVNFWASWCPPCLREFPDIIEVYNERHGAGLEVIAVSINAADETDEMAEFLQTFHPPFAIYRAASVDEVFFGGVADGWFGEIPMTLIFGTDGDLAHYYKKTLTYEELTSAVTALLAASGESGL